jgi:glycosyltransferase involved in cell wall biosynthesis
MIPVYNPSADYLAETLRSVLQQDSGRERMQIEIVDDCSPDVDVEKVVKCIAGDRVAISKTPA